MTIRKVLLVDDEAELRTIASLSLRKIGKWQVSLAASGAEALEKLSKDPPDLVLLDVRMAGLDGPETLRRIRALKEGAALPILFMTATDDEEERHQLLALGARGIIVKPFNPMTLPRQIRQILEQSS